MSNDQEIKQTSFCYIKAEKPPAQKSIQDQIEQHKRNCAEIINHKDNNPTTEESSTIATFLKQEREAGLHDDPFVGGFPSFTKGQSQQGAFKVLGYYNKYPELFDFLEVFEAGVKQGHKDGNWLEPAGVKMSRNENYASLSRHSAQYFCGNKLDQSGKDHRLHAAWRLLTSYCRDQRGIIHPDDMVKETKDLLDCKFMMERISLEFSGVVSDVSNSGVFVKLEDTSIQGLVHISTLPDDYYQFDPVKHILVGERSRRQFAIGDQIKIVVAKVDLDQCKIYFVLAEGHRRQEWGINDENCLTTEEAVNKYKGSQYSKPEEDK